MATKAEQFEMAQRQSRPKRPPQPRHKHERASGPVDGGRHGVTVFDHNYHAGAVGKTTYVAEASMTPPPPRKSTRQSADHTKTDAAQHIRQIARTTSPSARATRGSAQRSGKTPE